MGASNCFVRFPPRSGHETPPFVGIAIVLFVTTNTFEIPTSVTTNTVQLVAMPILHDNGEDCVNE